MKLVIIDYQLGNLFSVRQACVNLGYTPEISGDPQKVAEADALILPGVGAFAAAMDTLRSTGLADAILESVAGGKPLMGVCLGLQLLFERSEEFESAAGLGLIPGMIRRLPTENGRRVPQIAWNQIHAAKQTWEGTPLKDVQSGDYMYFVHSYYVDPSDKGCVLTETEYDGFRYCSAVLKNNIFATQFHPEKSGAPGLTIYKNWLEAI